MCTDCHDCGCNCGHAVAFAIYQSQRVALCCAAAAVAACLLVTLLITGGVGVGVGYHYCVVESKSYELDLGDFRNKYTSTTNATTTDTNNIDQSQSPWAESDLTDKAKQLQPRIGKEYINDQTITQVEVRRSEDKDERHKRKKNPSKEYKRTTWLYNSKQKQNPYKNPIHLNRTQYKQQRLYWERLSNKYNKEQRVKSLLLTKLGLNNSHS